MQPQADTPAWLQQAYDLTWLSAHRGNGDTVAIVDAYDDPAAASNLATFRAANGLPACTQASGCLDIVNEQGEAAPLPASDPGWNQEETLDLAAVSSICPNCRILLVEADSGEAADLQQAMDAAAALGADQISDSWSITAGASPFSGPLVTTESGQAAPAVFAASGDAGADAAGQAEYPAALPDVTAVGGTTLTRTSSAADPRGYVESAWSSSGSGCAAGESALTYQPAGACDGRAYADVSADADPASGLDVYEAADGGWLLAGGTSLATPMVAAVDALTGVAGDSPQWAYTDAAALNPVAGGGYNAPTGIGSISGSLVAGAPGITGPAFGTGSGPSDAVRVLPHGARLLQGLYPNDEAGTYYWQYGTSTAYGDRTLSVSVSATNAVTSAVARLRGLTPGTTYHVRLVAENASGTVDGPDTTFTTPAG